MMPKSRRQTGLLIRLSLEISSNGQTSIQLNQLCTANVQIAKRKYPAKVSGI